MRKGWMIGAAMIACSTLNAEDFDKVDLRSAQSEQEVGRNRSTTLEMGYAQKMGNFLPYHLSANQYGLLSPQSSQVYARASHEQSYANENWRAQFGGDLIFYFNNKESYYIRPLHLQQLYAKGNWGKYYLQVGSKEEAQQFVPELSSGNMVGSDNARPEVAYFKAGMDDFVHTFITGNLFEAKFNISWGQFTDGSVNSEGYWNYENHYRVKGYESKYWDEITDPRQHAKVKNAHLHRASAFVRTTSRKPFFVTLGVEHAAIYGGYVNGENCNEGWNWLRAMMGGSGKKENNQFNHVMSLDMRADLRLQHFQLGFYKQHYSDDMDGGIATSGADGLWGIDLNLFRRKWLRQVVVEYLQSTNQSGVVYANDVYTHYDFDGYYVYRTAGNSNFYHDQHMGAWAHGGMILGNPLLASPLYNTDGYPDMTSNMLRAYHLAFNGQIMYGLDYTVKLQHTDSWGTPFAPFGEIRSNSSWMVDLTYMINNAWHLNGRIAADHGSLYGNNFGFHLKLRHIL